MVKLSEISQGDQAIIVDFTDAKDEPGDALIRRLMELGFTIGAPVELAHKGPLGDPLGVRVHGALLGIGKREANLINVEVTNQVQDNNQETQQP